MRWLLRLVIFWVIAGPLFYLYGLPLLLEKVSAKARADAYSQCQAHLAKEGMVGAAGALLSAAQGEEYCHCLSDTLTLTEEDLPDVIQKKPPTKLTAQSQALSAKCNAGLQQIIRARYGAPADVNPAPVSRGLTLIENKK